MLNLKLHVLLHNNFITSKFCLQVISFVSFSEWAVKIPVILILGVATTLDALRNILPASSLQRLSPYKFTLGTPAERMDAVVETVLVKHSCGFRISCKVALFMRNYFVSQDGTLTSFIRALKVCAFLNRCYFTLIFVIMVLHLIIHVIYGCLSLC